MKKVCGILVLCAVLSGCSAAATFETLGAVEHEQAAAPTVGTVQIQLPESAAEAVFSSETESCYVCDGYTVILQTVQGGDIHATVKALSGFEAEKVTVLHSQSGGISRYEWVWTAAGEGGDVLCRAAVLDDGSYHYSLCTMAPAETAGTLQTQWQELFRSFRIDTL